MKNITEAKLMNREEEQCMSNMHMEIIQTGEKKVIQYRFCSAIADQKFCTASYLQCHWAAVNVNGEYFNFSTVEISTDIFSGLKSGLTIHS